MKQFEKAIKQEVEQLHLFFSNWFEGKISCSQDKFNQLFYTHFDKSFEMITPTGEIHTLNQTGDLIYGMHNKFEKFVIEIKDLKVKVLSSELLLVTYQERQQGPWGSKQIARISSTILKKASSAPNEVLWLHLHETLLQHQTT